MLEPAVDRATSCNVDTSPPGAAIGENLTMAADDNVSPAARLVGREHELARLRGLVADPPPGALIMVTGEAGIGKTSLVNQVVAERLAAGDRVLRGAGDERATARFSMWRRVMRELGVALPHADPSVGAADQVEELAATIGDSLATGAWRTIVLEDVHWADTSSVDVLQLVVDRLIACPVGDRRHRPPRRAASASAVPAATPIAVDRAHRPHASGHRGDRHPPHR